jgi:Flp pilus assembly protein TadB
VIARSTFGRSLAVALAAMVSQAVAPLAQAAAPHLVDAQQMASRLAEEQAARESRVRLVQDVLDSGRARQQAGLMGFNLGKMRAAVPHLTDGELKDLGARATQVNDVAAGHGDNDGLVIVGIVLLLAGLAVLVAVGDTGGYYDDCYCY